MPIVESRGLILSVIVPLIVALWGPTAFAQQGKIIQDGKGSYESERETLKIDAAGVQRLSIKSTGPIGGTITVRSTNKEPNLKFYNRYRARSTDEAEEFSKHISIKSTRSDDELTIEANADHGSPWQGTDQSARLYLEIGISLSAAVTVSTSFVDVEVYGPFKSVDVQNGTGAIRVVDVNGHLSASTANSPVHIEGIDGSIDVQTSNADIRAVNIASASEGRAKFRNAYGLIDVSGFAGSIDCTTSNATIDLRGAKLFDGQSQISTTFGSIDAEIVSVKNAELAVSNVFSNVDLLLPENLRARFVLKVARGGRIHMDGIPVTADLLDTESLIARTDDPDSKVAVDISGIGTISIRGEKFR